MGKGVAEGTTSQYNGVTMKRVFTNLLTLLLSLAGIVVAGYLTFRHFRPEMAVGCSAGPATCGTVLSSKYSHIGPIPTALFGLATYVLFLVLSVKRMRLLRASTEPSPELEKLNGVIWGLALAGMLVSWWLQYIALYVVVAFCPWCFTSATLLTVMAIVATYDKWLAGRTLDGEQKLVTGVVGFVVAMIVFIYAPVVYAQYNRVKREQDGKAPPSNAILHKNILIGKGTHFKGPKSAPLLIMEFADLQCESCRQSHTPFMSLLERYPGKVVLGYRHNPLAKHKWGVDAARATEAAALQGKFWEMQDAIFSNQDMLDQIDFSPRNFAIMAEKMNFNVEKYLKDVKSPQVAKKVEEDLKAGFSSGVQSTPTFFVVTSESMWRFRGMEDLMMALLDKDHPMWKSKVPVLPADAVTQ